MVITVLGKSTLEADGSGSCTIQCISEDPCFQGGDPSGTPWCLNADGTNQICVNAANCEGKSTLEADGSGSCTIQCVSDPCFQNGDPAGTPMCQNTDGSAQECLNPRPAFKNDFSSSIHVMKSHFEIHFEVIA